MINRIVSIACASVLVALVGCASEAEDVAPTPPETVASVDEALITYGKCAVDANNNLTGACAKYAPCSGWCGNPTANSACPIGQHVTDVVAFTCDATCGQILKTNVSNGHSCH